MLFNSNLFLICQCRRCMFTSIEDPDDCFWLGMLDLESVFFCCWCASFAMPEVMCVSYCGSDDRTFVGILLVRTSLVRPLMGLWCSGITSASHAEGPGFKPQWVQFFCDVPAAPYAMIGFLFHLRWAQRCGRHCMTFGKCVGCPRACLGIFL